LAGFLTSRIFVAVDCAYAITKHLLALYSGAQHFLEKSVTISFFYLNFLSGLKCEMAFGFLVKKWCILHTLINVKLSDLNKLFGAIIRMHSYCIDNRDALTLIQHIY